MASAPPPPPTPEQRRSAKEWPAGGEAVAALQAEFAELRDGLMGKGGLFPTKGALEELREGQRRAEEQRLKDKVEYHDRFDKLPDVIIRKLNGTYIKEDDLPFAIARALKARRRQRWRRVGEVAGQIAGKQGVQLLIGIAVMVFATLILGHVASNGTVP